MAPWINFNGFLWISMAFQSIFRDSNGSMDFMDFTGFPLISMRFQLICRDLDGSIDYRPWDPVLFPSLNSFF